VARIISCKWKTIDESSKVYYDQLARFERERYDREMVMHRKRKETQSSQSERYKNCQHDTSPPSPCGATSALSHISNASSNELSNADTEPICFEPNIVDLTIHFDNDMIDILEKTSW